uniref:SXP/RAL-2 family protein Ani s 5-like cation-binding domain-containing protein n=1 Tax=Setaria digitata TaxID=48799 RepID=A0A915PUM1_9BILA
MKSIIFLAIGLLAGVIGQQPEVPPFLVGAPESVVRDFFDLLRKDETKTDPQTEADIEAFVAKLGGDYKRRFDKFKEEVKQGRVEYEKIHQTAIAKFSPAAREADARMSAIADNPNLTIQEKTKQIQTIMNSLPDATRKEIIDALGPQ